MDTKNLVFLGFFSGWKVYAELSEDDGSGEAVRLLWMDMNRRAFMAGKRSATISDAIKNHWRSITQ